MDITGTKTPLLGGILSAFGASACCLGPLLLVSLGASGAWAARLRVLEPMQPLFLGATLLFLGFAFFRLYVTPRRCAPGEACAIPAVLRRQRILFWSVVALVIAMSTFPLYASLLV